ncbi:Signal transduction histidine kinase [Oceanobacillus limi]|uniref:Heme sensor protein HssS n=1 Tax=Oceanobacillus limi TaxID=930131 RepID=A0A1I0CPX5_9BACI|nr:HAMP domain-containing sensor histidine kinase [Oceanobacillus limi]SET21746.1 Signal transduction histidine kinase [Oceanobacillus limi]
MIKKSLYLKIVGIFISVVLISIVVSYFITPYSFQQEDVFKEEITKITSGFADIVEIAGTEKIPELMDTFDNTDFDVLITDGTSVFYASQHAPTGIPEKEIQRILNQTKQQPRILKHGREPIRIVGIPIDIDDTNQAMFIQINYKDEFDDLQHGIFISLLLVLLVGSILILLASRYLVQPIRKLTVAAKKVATGDFAVRVEKKRNRNQDEVGELITSFNHMASELEKIDQMRDDFVSNVSHEIQSPLTSIKGFTKALRDDVIPVENQKEYLDIIYQEIERLSRLSDNLLRIASLDSEHHPYNPTSYRLDEQLRNAVLTTEPQWKKKGLNIMLDVEPVEIFADADLMEQVWLNLITNAIRYTNADGTIHLLISITSEEISVNVKDDGIGIPKRAIPELFSRFYKVDQSRNRSVEGNGLGLSIVKKILNIHGFKIEVESEEGTGSTFSVKIPTHH